MRDTMVDTGCAAFTVGTTPTQESVGATIPVCYATAFLNGSRTDY